MSGPKIVVTPGTAPLVQPQGAEATNQEYVRLWNLYQKVGGGPVKDPAKFAKLLEKALEDGVISRSEFEDITGIDFTRVAWKDFIGGIKSEKIGLEALLTRMEKFDKYMQVTGLPLNYYAQCDHIIDVPEQTWAWQYRGMDEKEKLAFVAKHQQLLLKLMQGLGRAYNEPFLGDKVEVSDLDGLSDERLTLLFKGVFNEYHFAARSKGHELPEDLSDPLVARSFASGTFKKYLCGSMTEGEVTDGTIGGLKKFADQVKTVRKALEVGLTEGARAAKLLDELEPGMPGFGDQWQEIVRLAEDSPAKNFDQIRPKLTTLQAESVQYRTAQMTRTPGVKGTPVVELPPPYHHGFGLRPPHISPAF